MNRLPTKDELQDAWEELKEVHTQYLSKHDVKIPDCEKYNQRAHSIWLAVLFHFKEKPVHKDYISDVCQRDKPGLGRDQQVRHLKRNGWAVEGDRKGNHTLYPYEPSLEWINERVRRNGRLNAKTFDEIKVTYSGRCATCGSIEGRPDDRYGKEKVKLEQAHMDPDLSATDLKNIIPQCQFCNRAYRRDFTFDDKGRVRAVADIGPVRRASLKVQSEIFNWLMQELPKDELN